MKSICELKQTKKKGCTASTVRDVYHKGFIEGIELAASEFGNELKVVECTATNGCKVAIPVNKITGITEVSKKCQHLGRCFIATGADTPDGGENGWYVAEEYNVVLPMLECVLDT